MVARSSGFNIVKFRPPSSALAPVFASEAREGRWAPGPFRHQPAVPWASVEDAKNGTRVLRHVLPLALSREEKAPFGLTCLTLASHTTPSPFWAAFYLVSTSIPVPLMSNFLTITPSLSSLPAMNAAEHHEILGSDVHPPDFPAT